MSGTRKADALLRGPTHFLRNLVEAGGPRPEQYAHLDRCYSPIMALVRCGHIRHADLREIWPGLGRPFNTTETMQGFGILKPHGYAGDFEIIDRIYTRWVSPDPDLARWDEYFHHHKATSAVRNRKQYFLSLLERVSKRSRSPLRVLSVGCGPARECREWLEQRDGVRFDLLDRDRRALDYAMRLNRGHEDEIRPIRGNAFRFRPDERYHLIWAAGLFDYLDDVAFRRLARHLFRLLRPGGLLTIGNFGPKNPSRDYMEFGHWLLRHRSQEQLYDLATDGERTTTDENVCVDREPEDINLFLHLGRPA
jgi:SAM-dependent methyltransferase